MTTQYGEAPSPGSTSGYGDLHPVMQRHLNDLQQHVDNNSPTTNYGAQPFENNPVPTTTQPMSPEHVPVMGTAATSGTNSNVAQDTNAAQGAQLPNQTSMQGASVAGTADTNTSSAAKPTDKPANIQMGGLPNTPPANIDLSDINDIGRVANTNNAQLIQQHQAQMARNSPGQPSNLQMNNNVPSVAGFDGDQVSNARSIIQNGLQRGMSRGDIETAVMTALDESSLRNIQGGDRDSLGLFQQRPSQGWGNPDQIMDPNYAIGKFYDSLAGIDHSGMTPWQAAQAVQRSAFADGSNYQAQYANAKRLVDSLTQEQPQGKVSSPQMKPNGSLNWISQNTNKYEDYDGWYGAQCVDLYDFYTTGFVGGQAPMVGTADEIWNNHDANVYTQIDRGQVPNMGDVGVWGKGGWTPGSHVGIIIGDNGDGTVKVLSNNSTSAGNQGNSAITNISKSSLIGYLRPNRLMGA